MKIVITYRHKGDQKYVDLIKMAFASAKQFGYTTVLVHAEDVPVEADIRIGCRHAAPLMDWVLAAQEAFCHSDAFNEDSVLFSPDAIINRPLEEVFDKDFDIAVTVRNHPRYPINNGVIFLKPKNKSKLQMFFVDTRLRCERQTPEIRDWFGDQLSLHEELAFYNDTPYGLKCERLPCEMYNYTPPDAYITHFKGKRKDKMLALASE